MLKSLNYKISKIENANLVVLLLSTKQIFQSLHDSKKKIDRHIAEDFRVIEEEFFFFCIIGFLQKIKNFNIY